MLMTSVNLEEKSCRSGDGVAEVRLAAGKKTKTK